MAHWTHIFSRWRGIALAGVFAICCVAVPSAVAQDWQCHQGDAYATPTPVGVVLWKIRLTWLFGVRCEKQETPPTAHYGHDGPAVLPDPKVTPGKARTTDKNDPVVCGGKSTKTVRKPGIQAVYKAYGATKKPGVCCEIDHLISLELGGANDPANEWPQPYLPKPGAHEKDKLENELHTEVCAGKISLVDAQAEISKDWYAAYLKRWPAK